MVITPAFAKMGPLLAAASTRWVPSAEVTEREADLNGALDLRDTSGHVMIAGYGSAAQSLSRTVAAGGLDRVIGHRAGRADGDRR